MPVILKINPQKRVVHSTFFGIMTDQEVLNHSETIASHPDFRADFDEIVDLTMVTDPQVTSSGLREFATGKHILEVVQTRDRRAQRFVFREGGRI